MHCLRVLLIVAVFLNLRVALSRALVVFTPNVALNKTATQSSSYKHSTFPDPDGPQYAVDGNFSSDLGAGDRCAITDIEHGAWWQVDLGTMFHVWKVAITPRQEYFVHLRTFYIDISNNSDGSSAQQCAYEPTPYNSSDTRVYTCPTPLKGRYVRIRQISTYYQHVQLCEVQVLPAAPVDKTTNEIFVQNSPNNRRGFLRCLATCLSDKTCTAVNIEGDTCQLHSLVHYADTSGVDFYMEKIKKEN